MAMESKILKMPYLSGIMVPLFLDVFQGRITIRVPVRCHSTGHELQFDKIFC